MYHSCCFLPNPTLYENITSVWHGLFSLAVFLDFTLYTYAISLHLFTAQVDTKTQDCIQLDPCQIQIINTLLQNLSL